MVNVVFVKEYGTGSRDIYLSFTENNKSDFYCIRTRVGSEDGDWDVTVYKAFYDFNYGWRFGISYLIEFHNDSESEQEDFVEFLLGHFKEMMFS